MFERGITASKAGDQNINFSTALDIAASAGNWCVWVQLVSYNQDMSVEDNGVDQSHSAATVILLLSRSAQTLSTQDL